MKILINLTLIFILAEFHFCSCQKIYSNEDGKYNLGKHVEGEELFANITLRKIRTSEDPINEPIATEVFLEPEDAKVGGKTITYIEAEPWLDMDNTAQPAEFQILEGGIGSKNVKLKLSTKKENPIVYVIKIYGKQ